MSFLIKDPIVIDYETYYDDYCTVKKNDKKDVVGGNYYYVTHKDFEAYMLAFYDLTTRERGVIDDPKEIAEFVDKRLRNRTLIAHNAGFEAAVCWSIHRDFEPFNMVDTADLAQYLQAPRNLDGACKYLLGVQVDKGMRDFMKGKRYRDLSNEEKERMCAYAETDVIREKQIYEKYIDQWPDIEKWLSNRTRILNWRGVYIDQDFLGEQIEKVLKIREDAKRKIPWADDVAKPLSAKNLAFWCREQGIEPPVSLAEDSEDCMLWENTYGDKFPVVGAMRDYRKSNTYYRKLHLIERLLRPDGTIPLTLKYAAAPHTLRWSAAGFNIQSLPRPDIEPCDEYPDGGFTYADLRGCIIPKPGCVFIPSDLANIEARCLPWLAGDKDLLDQMAKGVDIYEVFARRALGYKDPKPLKKVDKPLRFISKTCVLGLGFQAGSKKFQFMLETMVEPEYLDRVRNVVSIPVYENGSLLRLDNRPENNTELASRLVQLYRNANPKIQALWYDLDNGLRQSLIDGGEYKVQLPSGRFIKYMNLSSREHIDTKGNRRMEVVGAVCAGDPLERFYGGKIAENITQGTARDVFAYSLYNLNKAGVHEAFHAHDEAVPEVPIDQAKDAAREIEHVMSQTPDWLPGCPIACETQIATRYCK